MYVVMDLLSLDTHIHVHEYMLIPIHSEVEAKNFLSLAVWWMTEHEE